jgi:N-acetyl-anhydromuramyl-L-alanine amidase AmpD
MLDIETFGNFKPIGKQKKKKQIILCHTSREAENFLASLQFRINEKYDKIPNFLITRTGKIFQFLSETSHTNIFKNKNINRNSVVIFLENLGWLEKKPLTNYYINWNGSIYNEEVYEKKWRDFFIWQPYTIDQLKVTAELCKLLTEELKINKKCVGHNTKIDGIDKYEGIVCRSNFLSHHTDLNPSFNFEIFEKFLENE